MFRRLSIVAATLVGIGCSGIFTSTAEACPSCKAANATDSRLPLAYQASILFMLSVPAVMCSALGFGLYRLNKAQVSAMEAFESGDVWNEATHGGEAAE
jgi:hypothetical protein